MNNYKLKIAEIIFEAVEGLTLEEVTSMVEVPTDTKMGDYAFPCFKLAKSLRKAPPMIAKDIAEKLAGADLFDKVESVNAYVNMYLSRKGFVQDVVSAAVAEAESFGRSELGKGKTVIVEYSSPNIAKPFHIGHIRSTVIGNSIYKIYDFLGYDTVRINHLGDYGTQFGKMIVAYRKWGNKEDVINAPIKTLLEYYTKFHVEVENDPSLDDEARAVFTKLENGSPEEVALWQWFRDESLKEFSRVYTMLGIEFDSYAGESFYSDKMGRILDWLKDKDLLVASEGAQIVDLEPYGMSPALITKKDGSTLYITRDIAAAVYRKETYDFYKNIYVVASQQNLHFQQWFKIVELMGCEWAKDCVHIPFGLVSLEEGTMSTRHGRVVFLEDVLTRAVEQTKEIILEKNVNTDNVEETAAQVGIGAVMFQELSNSRIKDYVFSWNKVLNFEGETGPYVQYTHARAVSILRKAGDEAVQKAKEVSALDMSFVLGDSAYELTKLLYGFPQVVVEAAEKYEPSVVTRHIVDIAQNFNRFYHDEYILVDNEAEKLAKIALVIAAKNTIKNGLHLLGIQAPEKM
ncbi:arginine--tRNA ligase [Clostridium aminobutyricum]|uniref:Arginine--tRNA ligase n=1 Tax=Clostridium aminobutyricum TaxID=33953 RepID=A0A939DAW2_CLOAM|nr:arginine--tRNA ligase [Clostridium aminobutyricum]MBN7774232.1 arginine--tRNA ligase [Clostridium aminobutyricum]